jgi:hypothetical protein
LLGARVPDCVLKCDRPGSGCAGRPAMPVMWSQMAKWVIISVRWWVADRLWRWGRKWGVIPLNAARNLCAPSVLRKPFMGAVTLLRG